MATLQCISVMATFVFEAAGDICLKSKTKISCLNLYTTVPSSLPTSVLTKHFWLALP